MKVLFFHNTIPEYRYGLFQELALKDEVHFVISELSLSEKIYGNKIPDEFDFEYITFDDEHWKKINDICRDCDCVVIQPPDGIREIILAYKEYLLGKKYKKKVFLFWERWNTLAPINKAKYKFKYWVHDLLVKPLIRKLDAIFVSGERAKQYAEYLGSKDVIIVGDSSSLPKCEAIDIRKKYYLDENRFVFLYLGRLVKIKGVDILIKAFNQMCRTHNVSDCVLLIAGDGSEKEYLESLVEKDTVFCGYVEPKVRRNYFEMCDCFILPSIIYKGASDAWGLTLNEAMEAGKPIITTTAVGAAMDLVTKETGIVVKENSYEDLSDALYSVYRTQYDPCSIKKYASFFSHRNVANNILKAMREHL